RRPYALTTLHRPTCRRPPSSTLTPYTTLFRSKLPSMRETSKSIASLSARKPADCKRSPIQRGNCAAVTGQTCICWPRLSTALNRSEEHTSELQSRENLVCRLLLEKKNTNETTN